MTGIAHAAGASPLGGGAGGIASFVPLILIFVVFLFPVDSSTAEKSKRTSTVPGKPEKGAKVITGGGIHGQITGLTDTVATLEIAENVRIKVNRASIMGAAADADKVAAPAKGGG